MSQVFEVLKNAPKGSFLKVTWKSNQKPAAKHKGTILEKVVTAVCRAGIEFQNLGAVKEGIASGSRGEVEALPWGEWAEYPYKIVHKENEYVRLYPPFRRNEDGELQPKWTNGQIETIYYVNGTEVAKEVYKNFLTPSDAKEKEIPHCFTVKATGIFKIGDETLKT